MVWSFIKHCSNIASKIQKKIQNLLTLITFFWQAHVSEFCWRWQNQIHSFHKYYLHVCISPELCRDESALTPTCRKPVWRRQIRTLWVTIQHRNGRTVRWRKTSERGRPVFVTSLLLYYPLFPRCSYTSRIAWSTVNFCWIITVGDL